MSTEDDARERAELLACIDALMAEAVPGYAPLPIPGVWAPLSLPPLIMGARRR